MLGRLNIIKKSQGGGSSSLNIFAQSTEPSSKEGIWINTSATDNLPLIDFFEPEGIKISRLDLYNNNSDYILHRVKDMPVYGNNGFNNLLCVTIGTYIYIVASYGSKCKLYRYDTITDTYLELSEVPNGCEKGEIVAIGTDIYIFGCAYSSNGREVYKYDTINDVFTRLTDMPNGGSKIKLIINGTDIYIFINSVLLKYDVLNDEYTRLADPNFQITTDGGVILIGTNIYFMNNTRMDKYDILTDTFTNLSNIPVNLSRPSCVAIGTDIFLTSGSNLYKYDTLNNNYTKLCVLPTSNGMSSVSVLLGDFIIIYGYAYDGNREIHLYDYKTDTITEIAKIPNAFGRNMGNQYAIVGNDMYIINSGSPFNNAILKLSPVELLNNFMYLFVLCDNYKVKISQQEEIPIIHASICLNNKLANYPAYYGNGISWSRLPD